MKSLLWLFVCICFLFTADSLAAANSDPRFFGIYCGDKKVCRGFGPFERCKDIKDIKARFNYVETVKGGLVHGSGTAKVDGKTVHFVHSGVVTDYGKVRGSATIQGLGRRVSTVALSDNGAAIEIFAEEQRIELNKFECNNTPPEVRITQFPTAPIGYGQIHFLRAEVTDGQDVSFPPERLIWTYDDVGRLEKSSSGLRASTKIASPASTQPQGSGGASVTDFVILAPTQFRPLPYLPPGEHTITFSATDRGGLTSQDSVTVRVKNNPPDTPTIFLPGDGDSVTAGCAVGFLGQAYDQEDRRFITGSGLLWRSNIDGNIGIGTDVKDSLATPGTHKIRLTATDSTGESSFKEHTVFVLPSSTGSCAPIARIVAPPHHEWKNAMVIVSGEKITFVGTAEDPEDLPDALDLQWRFVKPDASTHIVDDDVTVVDFEFSAIGQHEITFTATDADGNQGQDTMTIIVLSGPIL